MSYDHLDEIMLEVEKLNQLVMETCPEVFDNRFNHDLDDLDLTLAKDSLNKHRLKILSEASSVTKTH